MFKFDIESIDLFYSDDSSYELKVLTKMQARRLAFMSKVAIDQALDLTKNIEIDYYVYASKHGEINLSYQAIKKIMNEEDVSPTQFSQSVHNSNAGLYTIFSKRKIPVNAISAGDNSFLMGLINALVNLKRTNKTILYTFCDAKIPDVYAQNIKEQTNYHSIAMIIKPGDTYSLEEKSPVEYSDLDLKRTYDFFMNKSELNSLLIGENFCLNR